jgi:hypothetical protein
MVYNCNPIFFFDFRRVAGSAEIPAKSSAECLIKLRAECLIKLLLLVMAIVFLKYVKEWDVSEIM